jgi:prolyl oligopeptidase
MRLPCLLVALCAAHAFVARPLPRAPHRLRALDKGSALPTRTTLTDPREWLEDVEGDDALAWVRSRNAHALDALGEPSTKGAYERVLSILESNEKIPFIGRVLNGLHYNFWQDEVHVRGIWRRCTLDEFRKPEPVWEPVLDLDALAAADGVSWVWGGTAVLDEGPDVRKDRVMIRLSPGGSDATVAREFDLDSKQFVAPDQGGFVLPEAKAKVGCVL